MSITEVFLRWDGVYIPDGDHKHRDAPKLWRNSQALGECKGARPPSGLGRHRAAIMPGFQPTAATVLRPPRTEVSIKSATRQFAPGQEWTWIGLSIRNVTSVRSLVLQVRDASGTLVYTERLSRAQVWSLPRTIPNGIQPPLQHRAGEPAATAAARARLRWAHPDGSPYTFTILTTVGVALNVPNRIAATPDLVADLAAGVQTNDADASTVEVPENAQTNVVAGSLTLQAVPWAELYEVSTGLSAGNAPQGFGVARTRWVQYKLNELGWFAGPIDGNENAEDLQRAIKRYRQAHIGLGVELFAEAADNGFVFELSDREPVGTIDANLVDHLRRNRTPRSVVSTRDVFETPGASAKLFVDVERFCMSVAEKTGADGKKVAGSREFDDDSKAGETLKSLKERSWLSAPRLPLRARLQVRNTAGEEVWAPGVGHSLEVRWSWRDRAETTDGLPSDDSRATPNTTRRYVERATAALTEVVTSRFHNARHVVGGQITDDDAVNKGVVFGGIEGRMRLADPNDDWSTTSIGDSIYFCPSTIGGDNYQITATVSGKDTSSGWMTLWRRIHVTAHVGWGAPPSDVWPAVAEKYAHAYVELVAPAIQQTMRQVAERHGALHAGLAARLAAGAQQALQGYRAWDLRPHAAATITDPDLDPAVLHEQLETILSDGGDEYRQWMEGKADANITTQYNKFIAVLTSWRDGKLYNGGAPSTENAQRVARDFLLIWSYRHYLRELNRICTEVRPTAPANLEPRALRAWLVDPKNRAYKVFRALADSRRLEMCPPLDLTAVDAELLDRANPLIANEFNETRTFVHLALDHALGPGLVILEFVPNLEIGGKLSPAPDNLMIGAGKVLINRGSFVAYDPVHLFAHEIAHGLFLKHYKNAPEAVSADHDLADDNCVLSYIYLGGVKGPPSKDRVTASAEHYHPGNYRPEFCGKCNLKLRGWNIRAAAMPAGAD